MDTIETLRTLCFNTNYQALKNESKIKEYFGDRIIESKVLKGNDERGNFGFYVQYVLKE